jgi:hypothetical protein
MTPRLRTCLFVSLLLPPALAAQDPALDSAVDRVAPAIVELRHQIHQNP